LRLALAEPRAPELLESVSMVMSRPAATLLYEQAPNIDEAAVIKALRHFHPQACGDAKFVRKLIGSSRSHQLKVSGQTVNIAVAKSTLPDSEWRSTAEGSCNWDKAVEVCARHRAHVSVSAAEPMGKLACARLTCAVAGAIAIAHRDLPLAGLWQDGITVINAGSRFSELATLAFKPAPDIPTVLWVTMLSFTDHVTQTALIFTVGLGRFGHLELEFEAPLQHERILWDQCRSVIAYCVEHEGEQLGHGAQFAVPKLVHYFVAKRASERFNGVGVYAAKLTVTNDAASNK